MKTTLLEKNSINVDISSKYYSFITLSNLNSMIKLSYSNILILKACTSVNVRRNPSLSKNLALQKRLSHFIVSCAYCIHSFSCVGIQKMQKELFQNLFCVILKKESTNSHALNTLHIKCVNLVYFTSHIHMKTKNYYLTFSKLYTKRVCTCVCKTFYNQG